MKLDTYELLKILVQQNQVIIKQGEYIASLAYSIKFRGVSNGWNTAGGPDMAEFESIMDKTREITELVNDKLLLENQESKRAK